MRTLTLLSLSVLIAGVVSTASAQSGTRRGGGNYNPATETTLTGTVEAVKNLPSSPGGGGVHLVLAAPSGPVEVHVGPAWFVTSKSVTFAKGDTLTVVGSKVTMEGEQAVIAREIRKGEQVLTLRDANGFPLWSGRGRSQ
jgi:DNA/RNA endonuclease YhcR with UshA esterase domain